MAYRSHLVGDWLLLAVIIGALVRRIGVDASVLLRTRYDIREVSLVVREGMR